MPDKLLKKWKRIHQKQLELALYQYSLGVVTAGTILEELRMLKMLGQIEGAARRRL